MTKKEREQVVELLRCAADSGADIGSAAFDLTGEPMHVVGTISSFAIEARQQVSSEMGWHVATYEDTCLEAALRVEEGSWP